MKKFLALTLALVMVMSFAACGASEAPATEAATEAPATEAASEAPATEAATEAPAAEDDVKVMTHEEFMAAEMDTEVTVDTYVQAKQGWWEDAAIFYTQSEDGAYLLYKMACTEDEYNQLTEGTKIRVNGFKGEYKGEVEILDATFEILDGSYVAEAMDLTESFADEAALLAHQNEKVAFKGLTVEKIEYKNGEPGDDIYVTLGLDGTSLNFCVEVYLTGTDSDVYTAVGELSEGDVVDVEAYMYWYDGPNAHLTSVAKAA